MGGALLQKVDRDTQKFAFKCSYAEINGDPVDVQKHPLEMDEHGKLKQSFKKSKAGRLKLILTESGYKTIKADEQCEYEDQLVTVFENGEIKNETSFEAVRERATLRGKQEHSF